MHPETSDLAYRNFHHPRFPPQVGCLHAFRPRLDLPAQPLISTDLSEFDLVRVGDQAALNADCTIQTHLFEDRVMKMSTIDIAPHCKVGAGSLVLYDTRLEEGAALGDLSLLMKGETLPAWTSWQGIPALPDQ